MGGTAPGPLPTEKKTSSATFSGSGDEPLPAGDTRLSGEKMWPSAVALFRSDSLHRPPLSFPAGASASGLFVVAVVEKNPPRPLPLAELRDSCPLKLRRAEAGPPLLRPRRADRGPLPPYSRTPALPRETRRPVRLRALFRNEASLPDVRGVAAPAPAAPALASATASATNSTARSLAGEVTDPEA